MAEVIFRCEGREELERLAGYRQVRRHEYYDGEFQILPADEVSVRIEKGLGSAFAILNLVARSPVKFRRTAAHVRRDRTDVTILWFVRHGAILFTQSDGVREAQAGECLISDTRHPFQMDCRTDEQSRHETLHVIAPTQLVRGHLPPHVRAGATLSALAGDGRLALRTFELLFEDGGAASRKAAEALAQEAVAALGAAFAAHHAPGPRTLGDQRFEAVAEYIGRHLGQAGLSAEAVAAGVGISSSYLSHVLKRHGTSFSDMLWTSRLDRARAWLRADAMAHLPVSQIGYMAGFKSPAHFSRAFKSATGLTPASFRQGRVARPTAGRSCPGS
jgi:AraC-like DNA-binding protein